MATYQFGVVATLGSTPGLIQNLSITDSVQTAEALGATGAVAAFTNFNETKDFTAEFVFDTSGSAPTPGTNFSIDSAQYNITSVVLAQTNTDYKKCTLSGKRYVTNSLPTT